MALVATQQMVLVAQRVTQAQLEIRVIQAPTVLVVLVVLLALPAIRVLLEIRVTLAPTALVVLVEQQVQPVTKAPQAIQEILERMEWADQVAQLD